MIIPPIQVEKLFSETLPELHCFLFFKIPQEIPSELGRDGLWRARSACAAWESWQIAAMAVPKKVSDFKKIIDPNEGNTYSSFSQNHGGCTVCFASFSFSMNFGSVNCFRRLVSKSFVFIPVNFKRRGAIVFCYQFDSFYMILRVRLVHTIPEDSLSGPWVESDPEKVRATESWTQTGMIVP